MISFLHENFRQNCLMFCIGGSRGRGAASSSTTLGHNSFVFAVIYLGPSFLKEGLMYFLNKLFVKQVKSFCLLLDKRPFISCVHFTICNTTSPSYFYSITQLSHSLFPFKVILSSVEFICLFSTGLKFLQRISMTDSSLILKTIKTEHPKALLLVYIVCLLANRTAVT